jgi:opacity protein-like surface antigen
MSLRRPIGALILVVIVSLAAPSAASADWVFTPYMGGTFGGSAEVTGGGTGTNVASDVERKMVYGASLLGMGNGVGFEVDFSYAPNFFGGATRNAGLDFIGDGNVTTLMGNLVVGASDGAVRPYAAGGIGLMKSRVDSTDQFFSGIDSTSWGINVGGGIMGFISDNVGIRADLRYFRSLSNADPADLDFSLGDFDYWRGTVGLTIGFGTDRSGASALRRSEPRASSARPIGSPEDRAQRDRGAESRRPPDPNR